VSPKLTRLLIKRQRLLPGRMQGRRHPPTISGMGMHYQSTAESMGNVLPRKSARSKSRGRASGQNVVRKAARTGKAQRGKWRSGYGLATEAWRNETSDEESK
jgi:hypothetical protein